MNRDAPHHAGEQPLPEELSDNVAAIYLREIRQHELLTAEEEISLARRIEAGRLAQRKLETPDESLDVDRQRDLQQRMQDGQTARRLLIECNLRLVVSIARQYLNRGLSLLDLIQEGNIGLHVAVDKYEWQRGFRFSTHAYWWIRQAITRSLNNQSRTIRLPPLVIGRLARIARAEGDLQVSTGLPPSVEAVAQMVGAGVDRIIEAHTLALRPTSIDAQVAIDSDSTWGDLISDEAASRAAQREVETQELSEWVGDALQLLDPLERKILQMHFGLAGVEERSPAEIGEILGISRDRVRRIEQAALTKLRGMPRFRALTREYLAA